MYPQGYPPQPPGYPPPGYPPPPYGYGPPPPRQGMSGLAIGLIIGAIVLVLGMGGCIFLVVLGAAVSAQEDDAPVGGPTTADTTPAPIATAPNTGSSDVSKALETSLRAKGIPATRVTCPPGVSVGTYTCDLVIASGDTAPLFVTATNTGLKYETHGVAFLDGSKLNQLFQGSAGKVEPNLDVPCFNGMLMKKVGSSFQCDVFKRGKDVGDVTVTVKTADGHVSMKYTIKR